MKWLLLPLLWLAALVVAAAVLWRLWRGKNVVLRGRWSPQFVRMVVIVLVVLGVGVEKARPAPAPGVNGDRPGAGPRDEDLPSVVTAEVVGQWLTNQQPTSRWTGFKQAFVKRAQAPGKGDPATLKALRGSLPSLPEKFRFLVQADLDALESGKPALPVSPSTLTAALDELERAGCFDPWACAYLWRKTPAEVGEADRKDLVGLYARLERHARVTNTLVRARAAAGSLLGEARPWMSKAMRPPEAMLAATAGRQAPAEVHAAARGLYATSDSGTWRKDGLVLVAVVRDSPPPELVRGGNRQFPPAGQELRLGRLDLIETPAGARPVLLDHAWLGRIELPAGRLLSVWDLGDRLPGEAKARVGKAVADALNGDEQAAALLERALPLAHAAVRDGLTKTPAGKGAPRLRLILSLFDDAVTPGPEEAGVAGKTKGKGLVPADVTPAGKAANPKE